MVFAVRRRGRSAQIQRRLLSRSHQSRSLTIAGDANATDAVGIGVVVGVGAGAVAGVVRVVVQRGKKR